MNTVKLKWKKLRNDVELPKYETEGAACFDFKSADDLIIPPGSRMVVGTALAVEIPDGFELQIRARSGLAAKHGIFLVNGIGVVDRDYRGELKVILGNTGDHAFVIKKGDRIAQGCPVPVFRAINELVDELSETNRGTGGLGSTGV